MVNSFSEESDLTDDRLRPKPTEMPYSNNRLEIELNSSIKIKEPASFLKRRSTFSHAFLRQENHQLKFLLDFRIFVLLIIFIPLCSSEHQAAPYFVVQPSFSGGIVIEGQNKILQCQAVGFPAPEYKWLKDSQPLAEYSRDPLLRMNSIIANNSGAYQCVAKNAAGAIFSEKTELTVAYLNPVEEVNVTLLVRRDNAALIGAPLVDSVPMATCHWEKVGTGRLNGRKYHTSAENDLVILNVQSFDAGIYKVVFTNTQVGREIVAGFAELIFQGDSAGSDELENPLIVIPPKNTTFVQGSYPADLQCIVNASPLDDLIIEWTKDGIGIGQAGLAHLLSFWNRTLTLLNVVPSHQGDYQCRAYLKENPDKIVTASAHVTIQVKPSIVDAPLPETTSEMGHRVIIPCTPAGDPQPVVSWYRNAVLVGNNPEEDRYQLLTNGSLVISDLSASDSGIFQCLASNEAGETSGRTWLHVKSSAPVLVNPPKNLTVLDGKDAQIPCHVSGAPKPSITWTLNGTLPVHSVGRAQILDSGTLVLQSVEPRDAGTYTCSRTNSAGTVTGSAFLTVLVRTQIIHPPADTKVILSSTAELQCLVSHDPSVPYEVNWLFMEKPISIHHGSRFRKLPDGSLRIAQARNTDVGRYTCQVTSEGGDDSRSARLDVIELPYPPANVKAELLDTSPKKVNVSWSKAFDGNSPINMYIVQMRPITPLLGTVSSLSVNTESSEGGMLVDGPLSAWVTAKSNISKDERWTLLDSLKPSSSYQFRVSAVNGVGEGNPSLPTETLNLPPEPPSSPPQGVVGGARSSTSIMLQWQPPQEDERNGEILGYVIRYKLAGYQFSPWARENVTNPAQHTFLLQDLIVWQRYTIQVCAYNFKGEGVFSEPIYVRTREGVPQSAPTGVRIVAINSTAIQVWWKPPDPQLINGINQGYKVEAWSGKVGSVLQQREVVPPSPLDALAEQTALLGNLEKYSWYNVTVLCFTSPGDGPRSSAVQTVTHQDFPGQVGVLKFEDVLDTSVKVSWSRPEKVNGILLGYIISYNAKLNPEEVTKTNLSSSITEFEASGLKPVTAYTFSVCAWTAIGSGPLRTATIQSGIPPVLPEEPSRLAVSNIGAFSVVLQFTPGFDGNTSISKWIVEGSTKRRNESTWFKVDEIVNPDATHLEIGNLIPFSDYRLRLQAVNVVGSSPPSEPSKFFQTLQAPPSHPPFNVTVRAVNDKALRVRWTPLQGVEWYGIPRGYNVSFSAVHPNGKEKSEWRMVEDHNANSFVLDALEEFTEYTVCVRAFNDVGSSPYSSTSKERTRESVPFVGPDKVTANATSSTTIVVHWGEVPKQHQNGIIEGYKVYYGAKTVPFQYKTIEGNRTFTATLIELKKYTLYSVQVLAYTRIGDGSLSIPPVSLRTFEDVPGVPSNVSFPDVSTTTARIIWDVPAEPNGEISAYRVSYRPSSHSSEEMEELSRDPVETYSKELSHTDRTLKAFSLKPETNYLFSVTAKTREGWGNPANALVFTTNKREAPSAPSAPRISRSQIQARQMTFTWTPGRDGFAPLRYYTVQMAQEGPEGPWKTIPDKLTPLANSYTVTGLKPYTSYQFRLQATNDIGASGWSPESNSTRTLSAAPSAKPERVTVTPYTTTSVTVQWEPVPEATWNGDTMSPSYRVEYCMLSAYAVPQSSDCPSSSVSGLNASSVSLEHLEQDRMYEIRVTALNGQGEGPSSTPVSVYVGEAVPTGSPRDVKVNPLSSSEVRVQWLPPLENQQNGDLLGYKIFYKPDHIGLPEELEVVPVATTNYVLMDLLKFRNYQIQILAFNPAGDGPRSPKQFVKTLEDIPGAPGPLSFSEVTMTSLNISWKPPSDPNGQIKGYLITYETAMPDSDFGKHVKQKVTHPYLWIQGLRERVAYTFTVRAETVGLGPPSIANITTGPQLGSPGPPQDLHLQTTHTSVTLHWRNGVSGDGPLTGYLIQARESEESDWTNVGSPNDGSQISYTISFQNLHPSKNYAFRLFSRNSFGISFPAETSQPVHTPTKMYLEYKQKMPFYREVWFLVMLAATSLIIIILVVAILCVKSKAYKYKQEAQKSIQEDHMSMDDGGFATFELRQSKRGTLCKNTLSRKNTNQAMAKSPPRPSPASITYSDEEDTKGYDDNCDSSSLTEKPSEISSTDSQATDSDRESTKSDPHSFVNHYANVNETFRQSWKRQRPHIRPHLKPPSYTDSEPEMAVSLNGGHIVMNNLAGSRAPLPGFSSFV